MASYHLVVKAVQRSAGRSATAAAAFRAACVIQCEREGRVHNYQAKQGVVDAFIVAPEGAPTWVQNRKALWNAAEARDTQINSITAREWELGLPSELDADARRSELPSERVGGYVPLTVRGEAVHVAQQIRSLLEELHQGAEHPRED